MFDASDLKDLKKNLDLKDLKKSLSKLEADDVLDLLGLETRKGATDYLVPALGAFSVGLLLGAGLGLLMAPKAGSELRDDLRGRLQEGQEAITKAATQARAEAAKHGV